MMVLVYELPGTGKTSFASHLSSEIDAVHLNTDGIRDVLSMRGHYDEETKQLVYDELSKSIAKKLNGQKDVVVDGTFHRHLRREQIKKQAAAFNEPVFLIEIKADEFTVRKRLEQKRDDSEADFDVYKVLKREFEKEEDDHLELWSDREKAVEMVNKALKYLYG